MGNEETGRAYNRSVVFDWDLNEFDSLLANCGHDDTCALAQEYLPRQGKILEAGCGPGHVVRFLRDRGYDVEGIELSESVVRAVNKAMPDLPVRSGNVADVHVPDGYYAGLVSFGVIEHMVAGPQAALSEHFRVLRSGGIAIISVPSFNVIRRVRNALEFANLKRNRLLRSMFGKAPMPRNVRGTNGFLYQVNPPYGKFFEYRLAPEEFVRLVRAVGFSIIESIPTHHPVGLWVDFGERWVENRNRHFVPTRVGTVLDRVLRRFPFVHNHMHTIVAAR